MLNAAFGGTERRWNGSKGRGFAWPEVSGRPSFLAGGAPRGRDARGALGRLWVNWFSCFLLFQESQRLIGMQMNQRINSRWKAGKSAPGRFKAVASPPTRLRQCEGRIAPRRYGCRLSRRLRASMTAFGRWI